MTMPPINQTPEEAQHQYKQAREKEYQIRFKLITTFTSLSGLSLLIQNELIPGIPQGSYLFLGFRYTYLYLIFTSLLGFGLFLFIQNHHPKIKISFFNLFNFLYVSGGVAINYFQLHTQLNFTTYVVVLFAFILIYRPSLLVLSFYSLIFMIGLIIALEVTPLDIKTKFYVHLIIYSIIGFLIWWAQEKLWQSVFDTRIKLETKIKEEKDAREQLQKAQQQLIEQAHKAGMAEIATDTLHNVGNILNNIKTSTHVMQKTLSDITPENFSKARQLLEDNKDNLTEYIANDKNGAFLLDYFKKFDDVLVSTLNKLSTNTTRLNNKIDLMTEVIQAQQAYAGAAAVNQPVNIEKAIDETLGLFPELLKAEQISVQKELISNLTLNLPKNKFLHTLTNLLKNSIQAHQSSSQSKDRYIKFKTEKNNGIIVLSISDNGCGISKENLKRIFSHGFTTKQEGYGFGLHSCANYLEEMGASIEVSSNGEEKGTTFLISFPTSKGNSA